MVARNFPTLKKIAETISARFGCPWQDLGQVVRAFSDDELESALSGVLPGDIAERLQFAGIKCEKIQEKEKKTGTGSRKEEKTGNKTGTDGKKTAGKKTTKKATAKKTGGGNLARILSKDSETVNGSQGVNTRNGERDPSETINAGRDPLSVYHETDQGGTCTGSVEDLERVTGDVMPAGMQADGLPADIIPTIQQWIRDFGAVNDIDIQKMDPQQWRACCMYIGHYVKQNGLLRDHNRERKTGAPIAYSGNALESLLSVWAYFCGLYKKAPIVPDFINFSGVHPNFFYDYDGRGLTSTSVDIVKKARRIEENGLQANVSGGAPGAVGSMFLLKCRHGYQESPQVLQISPASAPVAGALPVFNSAVGALEDKKP